jgi:hypothetical protein
MVSDGLPSPGYRGIAFLLFENINLTYVRGTFPQFRIEVAPINSAGAMPRTIAETPALGLTGVAADLLYVDPKTNSVYVAASPTSPTATEHGLRRLNLTNLVEVSQDIPLPAGVRPQSFFVLDNGKAVFQSDDFDGAAYLYDPATNLVLSAFSDGISSPHTLHHLDEYGLLSRAALPFRGYDRDPQFLFDTRLGSGAFFSAVTVDGSYRVSNYDPPTATLAHRDTFLNSDFGDADQACVTACEALHCNGADLETPCDTVLLELCINGCGSVAEVYPFASLLFEQLYEDNTSRVAKITRRRQSQDVYGMSASALVVKRYELTDTGGPLKGAVYTDVTPTATFTIPASVWGGQTVTVDGLYVIDDVARRRAIVFLLDAATGSAKIIALDPYNNFNVIWTTQRPMLPHVSTGPRMSVFPSADYKFVDANGIIVSLSLTDGQLTEIASLNSETLPAIGGAQFYDPTRNAITYITNDNPRRVVRIYPERIVTGGVSVATVLRDMSERVGIMPYEIDVSDIEDIRIIGIGLTSDTSPRAVVAQLTDMFGLSTFEQDGRVLFRRRSTGDEFSFTAEQMIPDSDGSTYVITRKDPYIEPSTLSLVYADIHNFVRPRVGTMSHAVTAEAVISDAGHNRFETAAALEEDQARSVLDALFTPAHTVRDTVEFSVFSRYSGAMPNDYVNFIDEGGVSRRYQVSSIYYHPNLSQISIYAKSDAAYIYDGNASATLAANPFQYVAPRGFAPTAPPVLRAFDVTPYTEIDMLASGTHRVIYLGVETAAISDFVEYGTKHKVLNDREDVHIDGPSIVAPLRIGRVLQRALGTSSWFDTDTESVLIVQFRSDITSVLENASQLDVLNDRERNVLLVGKEWVQWQNHTVSPTDPRIVTFTRLLRGRNGSDAYVNRHVDGEEVILPTPGSMRPLYILSSRIRDNESVSVFIRGSDNITALSPPTVVTGRGESIRPWAPTDVRRFTAPSSASDIVVSFEYRSKHTGEIRDGADGVVFEPTPENFARFSDRSSNKQYNMRFVVYFSGHANGVPPIDVVENMMRGREENLGGVFGDYHRIEVAGETEATFTAASQAFMGGFNRDTDPLYTYIAQIGGPRNDKMGFVRSDVFPPGAYPVAPYRDKMRVRKTTRYVVLSPDSGRVYNAGWMAVLRP